jgi:hypothetical protein
MTGAPRRGANRRRWFARHPKEGEQASAASFWPASKDCQASITGIVRMSAGRLARNLSDNFLGACASACGPRPLDIPALWRALCYQTQARNIIANATLSLALVFPQRSCVHCGASPAPQARMPGVSSAPGRSVAVQSSANR